MKSFLKLSSSRAFLFGLVILAEFAVTSIGRIPLLPQIGPVAFAEEEMFKKYEIRVIRPRYFTKAGRFEVGSQLNIVMNQTFIYSYLMSGILTYHFNEIFAFELNGAFGISIDKSDKKILKSDFDIRTQILRPQYIMGGSLVYTPIYGKYQLMSGHVIYFDTFLTAGVGMTGIQYLYDHCTPLEEIPVAQRAGRTDPPGEKTVGYPTFMVGMGQKFFINKKDSIRWDVRNSSLSYALKDGSCEPDNPNAPTGSSLHHNVTMQIGVSRFF